MNKATTAPKPQTEPRKIGKYYTNYGRDNHNINTCRMKKKEESILEMKKATTHNQKIQKTISYACPICDLNGHKMTNCSKFVEMLQGKNASNTNGKSIVNVKIITIVMNVVDVNVTTNSKITQKKCSMNKN